MATLEPKTLLIAQQQLKSTAMAGLITDADCKELESRMAVDPDADITSMLSYMDIAEACGVCVSTVRNWRREGRLTPINLGPTLVRFNKEEVLALQEYKHPSD